MSNPTESTIRFEIGQLWRDGDCERMLNYHRQFPLGSEQRGIAIDAAQKILFADEQSI